MKNFNNRYFCKNIHRYFTDISDISVKFNYRYIRVYRYFDPCSAPSKKGGGKVWDQEWGVHPCTLVGNTRGNYNEYELKNNEE